MRATKSCYSNSRLCVRVGKGESYWFELNVGLRQGCVMSLCLFNVCMDGVVRKLKARVQDEGLLLVDKNGREVFMNQLLFAGDTALEAESEKKKKKMH